MPRHSCSDGMCGADDCRKCHPEPACCDRCGVQEDEDHPLDRTYADAFCADCLEREERLIRLRETGSEKGTN